MLVDWLPAWLLWLLPVPLATFAAIAWASWSGRARGPVDAEESVRAHERFRAAMATGLPTTGAAELPTTAPRER